MEHYRIYPMHEDGSIATGLSVECDTDDQAIQEAAEQIGDHPVIEVWCGTRKVGRFTATEITSRRRRE